jgi:hypothetical protein
LFQKPKHSAKVFRTDMLAVAVAQNLGSETVTKFPSAKNENWLPSLDAFRTFLAKSVELGFGAGRSFAPVNA